MTTNYVKAFNALECIMFFEIVVLAALFAAGIAFGFAIIYLAAVLYLSLQGLVIPWNLLTMSAILPVLVIFLASINYILPQCLSVMDDLVYSVYAVTKTDQNERWIREKWEHYL